MTLPDAPDIPHHYQETDYTCGPAAVKMVLEHLWGIRVEEESLAARLGTDDFIGTRQRVLLRFIQDLGFTAHVRHTDTALDEIRERLHSGHIVMVCYYLQGESTDHYAIVKAVTTQEIILQDPWLGPDTALPLQVFDENWHSDPTVDARRDRWLLAIEVPQQDRAAAPRV